MNYEGVYRRYDGRWFICHGVIEIKGKVFLEMSRIDYPKEKVGVPIEVIEERYYEVTVIEDGENKTEKRPIREHQSNLTGQETYFWKCSDLENVVRSFSEEQLVTELAKRDTVFQDLDIENLNDKVFCSEIVIGIPQEEKKDRFGTYPRGVEPKYICKDMKDAVKTLEKVPRGKIYRRSWVEYDKVDMLKCLQENW